jgi:hypothetical protein
MPLLVLTEWEDNGYHDSYFHESWWNTETGQVEFHEVGATAYAGRNSTERAPISDPAELEKAIAWLADHIYHKIRAAEHRDVLTPEPVNCAHGREFRLLRNCRHKGQVLPAGTVGECIRVDSFGTFYRNGYNRPNRENSRVTLRLPDGSYQTVALSACRQNAEPMADAELMYRARDLARDCQFSTAGPYKYAWDSKNHAAELMARIEAQRKAA